MDRRLVLVVPPVRLERTRPKRAQPLKLPCMPFHHGGIDCYLVHYSYIG
jgi:hypothetical protein